MMTQIINIWFVARRHQNLPEPTITWTIVAFSLVGSVKLCGIISGVLWSSLEKSFAAAILYEEFEKYTYKLLSHLPCHGQWAKDIVLIRHISWLPITVTS